MRSRTGRGIGVAAVALMAGAATAATNYVWTGGTHTAPYDTWTAAATNIQTAVDYASTNYPAYDTVLVTDDTYSVTAQVTITNAITLRSVNGPDVTTIRRASGAIRVVEIQSNATGAVLSGFTVRDGNRSGDFEQGGGIRMLADATVSNCVISSNTVSGGGGNPRYGAGVYMTTGLVVNCRIINNATPGVYWGDYGGGVYMTGGTLVNCIITNNSIGTPYQMNQGGGGGVYATGGDVVNCLLARNAAQIGGGYRGSGRLVNCTIAGNAALPKSDGNPGPGAGIYGNAGCTATNTIVFANTNHLGTAADYAGSVSFAYSCTTPLPAGPGNRSDDPGFVSLSNGNFRLQAGSPALDAGTNLPWMAGALDLEGRVRIYPGGGTNDMGAYEYQPGALSCYFVANTNAGNGSAEIVFTATVGGTNLTGLTYLWDFHNDGAPDQTGAGLGTVTNTFGPGLFSVALTVSNTVGESATFLRSDYVRVSAALMYVSTNGTQTSPFTNWMTAATNIQTAMNLIASGTVIRVSNGVYSLAQQITINVPLTLESVNGPEVTTIRRASGSIRVVEIQSNAVGTILSGFTVRDGGRLGDGPAGEGYGGGIRMLANAMISNCVISSNSVSGGSGDSRYGAGVYMTTGLIVNSRVINNAAPGAYWGDYGGGVYMTGGMLLNCIITNNTIAKSVQAVGGGGGVYAAGGDVINVLLARNAAEFGGGYRGAGRLVNCTVADNAAVQKNDGNPGIGAGVYGDAGGVATNTIVHSNTNHLGVVTNYAGSVTFAYSCATPLPAGTGNLDVDPLFVNTAASNYRLQKTSPCINKGTVMAWMTGAMDLDGRPRVQSGGVDLGVYEMPAAGTIFVVH